MARRCRVKKIFGRLLLASSVILFSVTGSFGQTVSDEAQRHFDRGMAAVEAARSRADYESAIREFEQAARLAPDWPKAFRALGVMQEKTERFKDAVISFRHYLELAPNAGDAEDIRSRINGLEFRALPQPAVAKGFMGLPWGASPEQIDDAMNRQGYQRQPGTNSDILEFTISWPLTVGFFLENNVFYWSTTEAIIRTPNSQVAYAIFKRKIGEMSQEYGPPQSRDTHRIPDNEGGSYPYESATWDVVDPRTSDHYSIKVELCPMWYTDTGTQTQFIVNIDTRAESLSERLKKKGRGGI